MAWLSRLEHHLAKGATGQQDDDEARGPTLADVDGDLALDHQAKATGTDTAGHYGLARRVGVALHLASQAMDICWVQAPTIGHTGQALTNNLVGFRRAETGIREVADGAVGLRSSVSRHSSPAFFIANLSLPYFF
jgi:hypothetical protein